MFVVASHRNPDQVARLVRRLKNDLPDAFVVVHHDQSKSLLERGRLPAEGVVLVEDARELTWGGASQVRATVRCLDLIVRERPDFAWVVFLSGQDYPVRHLATLPQALAATGDGQLSVERDEFAEPLRYELTWFRLPERLQTPAARALFERLIFHLNGRQRFARFASGRIGCSVGLRLPSPLPKGWRCYQGSQWWALGRRAVLAFLEVRTQRPRLYRWLVERSIIPDEGIFQTVLLNLPGLRFGNSDLRYIRWNDRASGSPDTFGLRDAAELLASGRFFARKFDSEIDATILDVLDDTAAGRIAGGM